MVIIYLTKIVPTNATNIPTTAKNPIHKPQIPRCFAFSNSFLRFWAACSREIGCGLYGSISWISSAGFCENVNATMKSNYHHIFISLLFCCICNREFLCIILGIRFLLTLD